MTAFLHLSARPQIRIAHTNLKPDRLPGIWYSRQETHPLRLSQSRSNLAMWNVRNPIRSLLAAFGGKTAEPSQDPKIDLENKTNPPRIAILSVLRSISDRVMLDGMSRRNGWHMLFASTSAEAR